MVINTSNFKTKNCIIESMNPTVDGFWPLALDVGYSALKGISPNSMFVFPSYARNLGKNPVFFGSPLEDEILYRDNETGDIWRVGSCAQRAIDVRDTNDSQLELYGRERYFSKMFAVIVRTGLALGIKGNSLKRYNGEPIMIQTGLPPAFLEEDREHVIDAICGIHKFAIKTGKDRHYTDYMIEIPKKSIGVMSQPEGTLMNLVMDQQANSINDAKHYFQANILIFDAGFGTVDVFDLLHRTIQSKETFTGLGMREVLQRTCQKIKKNTGVIIRPSAMQNSLESGVVTVQKRNGLKISSNEISIAEWLLESSKEVCDLAVEKIMNMYSGLFQYDYLVLTGGTSAAWEAYIKDYFAEVSGLSVIMGNANCPEIDLVFCNVRGYYVFLINSLRKRVSRKQEKNESDYSTI